MESGICGVCLQSSELFQVSGYPIATCLKCSEQIARKSIHSPPDYGTTNANPGHVQQMPPLTPAPTSSLPHGSTLNLQHQPPQIEIPDQKSAQNINFDLSQIKIDEDSIFDNDGCPICNKTFGRKSSLINHIRNHSAEKKYVCTFCQKGFTQAANLRNHERIHTNDRPYICHDCGKAFTQITNLNNHRRLHTGERPFVCIENECGRSFAQVTNLNNHMKTHHKVQQYVCNQCPGRFTQVSQLNLHLTTHGGLKGLVCPQCPDKSFKQQGQLQQHLKTHGIEFPFACGRCDEKFIQFVHLEHHMKMHEEFRFKCTMCSSSFNQEVLLKKHIQRHIDGRYLTCPVEGCNEGFTIKHHLTRHMQTHHSINNYTKRISVKRLKMSSYCRSAASGKYNCYFESCDESFSDAETLNEHLRHVHGLSIVKNAGKRSKMDLMLLEQQMKQQEQQQNQVMNDSNNVTYREQSGGSSSKQIERKPHSQHYFQQINTTPVTHETTLNGENYSLMAIKQERDQQLIPGQSLSHPNADIKVVCSFCYSVFKSQHALDKHIQKFHS